jgi:hypothetical protein
MLLNSMRREEPYLGLTCRVKPVKAGALRSLHRWCMAVVSSCREVLP